MITIGVLVPTYPAPPPPPENKPVGRAALLLAREGICALFGDRIHRADGVVYMAGVRVTPGGWVRETNPMLALHDRFPSQRRADRYRETLAVLGALPMGNPASVTLLCRDKIACQDTLTAAGVPMPAIETEPQRMAERLAAWGAGFLKPRYGALGIGVRRVLPGERLPEALPGAVPGVLDPAFLQQAVPAPAGWAGRSVRALVQRLPGGSWHFCPPVVRQSREDFVVNAARGAQVAPADDVLSASTMRRVAETCEATCHAIASHEDGAHVVELGLDMMIDDTGRPQLIEVNSRPRGRLEALAALDARRFGAAHIAACARPLRYLASSP